MEKIQKFWQFLDGKKSVIGLILLFGSAFLEQVVKGIWGVDATWVAPAADTLDWFGMALGATGLGHKWAKVRSGNSTPAVP